MGWRGWRRRGSRLRRFFVYPQITQINADNAFAALTCWRKAFAFHLRHLRHLRTIAFLAEVIQQRKPQYYLVEMEVRDPRTYAIIGAAMEVHSQLGPGFLESVYQEALAREFTLRNIPFEANVELPVYYKGERLKAYFKADFICFRDVVVELKALRILSGTEEAQILNYLKATGIERGVLLNFGEPQLRYERRILSRPADQ